MTYEEFDALPQGAQVARFFLLADLSAVYYSAKLTKEYCYFKGPWPMALSAADTFLVEREDLFETREEAEAALLARRRGMIAEWEAKVRYWSTAPVQLVSLSDRAAKEAP
jgi:hypothetical protein